MARATEDQFLGSLLGLSIGDALGRPVSGLSADDIAQRYGRVREYLSDDGRDEGAPTGIITDESEVTLCIVESLTTNDGLIDPENINARLSFLVRGDSRRWMPESVIEGIIKASGSDGLVPESGDDSVELSVSVRGVPIGLVHAFGAEDDEGLMEEAGIVSRFSHGSGAQRLLTFAVAKAVRAAALDEANPLDALQTAISAVDHGTTVLSIARQAFSANAFEDAVFDVVNAGGPADTTGALAGAIAGARFGASGIPQALIDQLDARIYLSLAAPWFFRTSKRRAGTVIDLRVLD